MRNLSLAAMTTAIFYLVAGIGILLFQDALKPLFLGSAEFVTVYPPIALVRLAFVGLPCTILGAINVGGSHSRNRLLPLGIAIYSGFTLGLQSLLGHIFSTLTTATIAHMGGVAYLANLSTVNSMFEFINVFSNVALVLLLVAGVMEYCKNRND